MSYTEEYGRTDRYILSYPDTAIDLVKGMMNIKGEKDADMAVLNQSTKQKVHRFMNGNVKASLPDECRIYARSLGAVLRLSKDSEGNDVLVCGPAAKKFDVLLREFCMTDDPFERDIIAGYEMPVSIRQLLTMTDIDFIVETNDLSHNVQMTLLPEPHKVIFRNRYYQAAEFGILISPDASTVMLGVWTSEDKDRAVKYRKAVGMGDADEEVFREILEKHGEWMGPKFTEQFITLTPIDVATEGDKVSANLDVFHYIYERFVYVLAGIGLAKDFEGPEQLLQARNLEAIKESGELPKDVKEHVLKVREHKCEVDSDHELFNGKDGEPYLKVLPLIPITSRTAKKYGDLLSSEANAVVVCPLCAEKLKHAEWSVKENIIMELYDQRVEELKEAGMEVSRFDLLTWQKEEHEPSGESGEVVDKAAANVRFVNRMMAYAKEGDE